MLLSAAGLPFLSGMALGETSFSEAPDPVPVPMPSLSYPLYDEAVSQVMPVAGFRSSIALENSVLKLIEFGVIDRGKFFALYSTNGPLPGEFDSVLSEPSNRKILLTSESSQYYVNLLWPVGLANYMAANAESPLNGDDLYTFASTGGWTLGGEENGGAYFNKLPIVSLRTSEEARVVRIAKSIYRPCCNNSTFFQDCNHGSALLGLLQLGASQGLSDDELYDEALAFNAFWFPDYYLRTALFFKVVKNVAWQDVDPRVVLSAEYSAGGPWQENVAQELAAIPGLIPPAPNGGAGCGV